MLEKTARSLRAQILNVRAALFYYSSEPDVEEVGALLGRLRAVQDRLYRPHDLRGVPDELDGVRDGLRKLGGRLRSLMETACIRRVVQLVTEFDHDKAIFGVSTARLHLRQELGWLREVLLLEEPFERVVAMAIGDPTWRLEPICFDTGSEVVGAAQHEWVWQSHEGSLLGPQLPATLWPMRDGKTSEKKAKEGTVPKPSPKLKPDPKLKATPDPKPVPKEGTAPKPSPKLKPDPKPAPKGSPKPKSEPESKGAAPDPVVAKTEKKGNKK